MTDRSKLLALAEAVEKLPGPDQEVDERIGMAIGLKNTIRVGHECLGTDRIVPVRCPAYTASLDAAMTLVPEGCLFTARTVWDKMTPAGLGFISRYEKGEFNGHERLYWMDEHQAVAATPALALCAAALRAQAEALA